MEDTVLPKSQTIQHNQVGKLLFAACAGNFSRGNYVWCWNDAVFND